jgi:putative acetyltransferase
MIREPVVIRPYVPDDVDACAALFTRTVRAVASRDYDTDQLRAWAPDEIDRERWAARLGGRPTFVATIGGEMAGFSDLEPDGHIDMLFVHADHQGRGVAAALLAHVEAQAVALRLGRLFTEASITARGFFERQGFRVIAAQDVEVRGQTLRNYRMEKRLAAASPG